MQEADRTAFCQGMNELTVLGGGNTVSELKLEVYWRVLSKLSVDQFRAAVVSALTTLRYFPAPAELLALAGETTPSSGDRALEAWQYVFDAVRKIGHSSSVVFDDPLVGAAVRAMGGWRSLCQRPASDFTSWARKEFVEAYEAASRNPPADNNPLPGAYNGEPREILTLPTAGLVRLQ